VFIIFFMSWRLIKLSFRILYFLDLLVLWFIVVLVETNRRPYDFAEGESELVSGYNIEYIGVLFAFMFISEYGLIIIFSWITSLIIVGGVGFIFVLLLILIVRGFIPRSRYDILIMVCWKFLFIVLSFIVVKVFII